MKIGDRVFRKDAPEILGMVLAKDGVKLKVYWSTHKTQWLDAEALMLADNPNDSPTQKEDL
jgi:hypothetical protein